MWPGAPILISPLRPNIVEMDRTIREVSRMLKEEKGISCKINWLTACVEWVLAEEQMVRLFLQLSIMLYCFCVQVLCNLLLAIILFMDKKFKVKSKLVSEHILHLSKIFLLKFQSVKYRIQ